MARFYIKGGVSPLSPAESSREKMPNYIDNEAQAAPSYDFHAKHAFLTYPQCPVSKEDMLQHLLGLRCRISFASVAHELHEDGGDHLHVFLTFERKFRTRNPRYFDFKVPDSDAVHHPNVQSPRDIKATLDYVEKEDDYIRHGEPPKFDEAGGLSKRDAKWGAILAEATSVQHFMQLVRQQAPYDFATRYNQLYAMATAVYPPTHQYTPRYTQDDFNIPDEVNEWLLQEFDSEVS